MKSQDIFWLAQYAHATLDPLMEPLEANLRIELVFKGMYPGVCIWVQHNDVNKGVSLDYRLAVTTWQVIEEFALALTAKLQAKASVAA